MSLPVPPRPVASRTSLFLDIDGTLAAFERLPDEVVATPELTGLLRALRTALDGRVALISGRALSDMDRITEKSIVAASGVHGLEHRRADGRVESAPVHPAMAGARGALQGLVADHPGLVLEDKGLGLVLHYRAAPELQAVAHDAANRLAQDTGLGLQRGDMMIEVRTPGRDKGDALRTFMAEPPFAGFTPIYVGDDLTDEHAFKAAAALGGFGVLVGRERLTEARYRLADVAAVHAWLADAAAPARPAAAVAS